MPPRYKSIEQLLAETRVLYGMPPETEPESPPPPSSVAPLPPSTPQRKRARVATSLDDACSRFEELARAHALRVANERSQGNDDLEQIFCVFGMRVAFVTRPDVRCRREDAPNGDGLPIDAFLRAHASILDDNALEQAIRSVRFDTTTRETLEALVDGSGVVVLDDDDAAAATEPASIDPSLLGGFALGGGGGGGGNGAGGNGDDDSDDDSDDDDHALCRVNKDVFVAMQQQISQLAASVDALTAKLESLTKHKQRRVDFSHESNSSVFFVGHPGFPATAAAAWNNSRGDYVVDDDT